MKKTLLIIVVMAMLIATLASCQTNDGLKNETSESGSASLIYDASESDMSSSMINATNLGFTYREFKEKFNKVLGGYSKIDKLEYGVDELGIHYITQEVTDYGPAKNAPYILLYCGDSDPDMVDKIVVSAPNLEGEDQNKKIKSFLGTRSNIYFVMNPDYTKEEEEEFSLTWARENDVVGKPKVLIQKGIKYTYILNSDSAMFTVELAK